MSHVIFARVAATSARVPPPHWRTGRRALAAIAILAALTGCGSDDRSRSSTGAAPPPATTATAATIVVEVKDMKFSPATVTIKPGDTIQWKFADKFAHSVEGISDTALEIHSPILLTGEWSHKFTSPGNYRYLCPLHPQMKGSVVVRA